MFKDFPNNGYLYIFHGEKYMKEALLSVESLKKIHPNAHVTAFTDVKLDNSKFDYVKLIKPTSIRSKVNYIHESPYDKTIFLDTDTIIYNTIEDIFILLERYDFCLAHDLARKRLKYSKIMKEYAVIPYGFSELNTGVIGFKKSKNSIKCFKLWRNYYNKYYKRILRSIPYDQPSFRIALWQSLAHLYILPPEYNVRSQQNRKKQDIFKKEMGEEHLAKKILHMHHGKENLEDAIRYSLENAQEY